MLLLSPVGEPRHVLLLVTAEAEDLKQKYTRLKTGSLSLLPHSFSQNKSEGQALIQGEGK